MKMTRVRTKMVNGLKEVTLDNKRNPIQELFFDIIMDLAALTDEQRGDVAEASGVGKSTLYFWTHGETFDPRVNNVIKVAWALGYEITMKPRADGQSAIKVRKPKLRIVK